MTLADVRELNVSERAIARNAELLQLSGVPLDTAKAGDAT